MTRIAGALMIVFQRLYLWACERLYNEFAWSYDVVAWLVSGGRWAAWRRLALNCLPDGTRVLELGFGTGELLSEMARGGRQVYGLELSPAMQRIAGRKLRRRGLAGKVGRVQGMAQALPFPDEYFDAVIATFPARYILAPETTAEIARVLRRPGTDKQAAGSGRLVVGGLAVAAENARLGRLLPVFFGWPPPEFFDHWRSMLVAAGLRAEPVVQSWQGARVLTLVAERTA